eukprot:scaffold282110_cov22-Tisochrysis_lutea.AAC.1
MAVLEVVHRTLSALLVNQGAFVGVLKKFMHRTHSLHQGRGGLEARCTHHWARMYQPIERHGTLGEKQAGRDKLLLLTLGASQQGRQRWGTALELWGLIQERFRQGKPEAKQAGHDRSAAAHP